MMVWFAFLRFPHNSHKFEGEFGSCKDQIVGPSGGGINSADIPACGFQVWEEGKVWGSRCRYAEMATTLTPAVATVGC